MNFANSSHDKRAAGSRRVTPPAPADTGQTPPPPPPQQYPPVQAQTGSDQNTCIIVGVLLGVAAVFMIVVLAVLAAILLPALARAREAARRASCMNNLKQCELIFKIHADDDPGGYWPPLSSAEPMLMFEPDSVDPGFFADPQILFCPSNPDAGASGVIGDHSYVYFGYALTSEDELLAFLESYPGFMQRGADFTQDLPAPSGRGSFGGDEFLRLREDVGADAGVSPGEIPVMFDTASNHVPAGSNVLYLDGRVEFVRSPGFPITQAVAEALDRPDVQSLRMLPEHSDTLALSGVRAWVSQGGSYRPVNLQIPCRSP